MKPRISFCYRMESLLKVCKQKPSIIECSMKPRISKVLKQKHSIREYTMKQRAKTYVTLFITHRIEILFVIIN